MAENNFLLPVEEYQRDLSPVRDWLHQSATYVSKMKQLPYEEVYQKLEARLRNKEIRFKNPTVVFFERDENGDRDKVSMSLSGYIKSTIANNNILVPTFTTYLHPSVVKSVIVGFLDKKVAIRKKYKKMSQAFEAAGDISKYKYYHQLQDSAKRENNSVSGGFVAEGSVINNRSAHSTLTSITRSIASLSNSSNERLIEGNRHYLNPQIALNNLISITSRCDHKTIIDAVETYGLTYPTVEDVVDCVHRSLSLYVPGVSGLKPIRAFVERLLPVERAAIVYTGDLYHLRILNEGFIRKFLTDLSARGSATPLDNPVDSIKQTDEQIVNYAHQINIDILAGIGKDYDLLTYEQQCILANTCKHIEDQIDHYKLFLKAFFLTRNSPCTVSTVPTMIRRAVVLSDTDSTMFSVDSWVDWYFGKLEFTPEAYGVAGAVMFMATQSIAHILALFSANMNVERSRLFTLAMKPEYVFPVFAQTSVAKHYYTAMLVKEGSVYKDIKMEIKGVHMKDSTVPGDIIKRAAKLMEKIIRTVMGGKKINLEETVKEAIDKELEILTSLAKNETTYLKRFRVKEANSYKKGPTESPFQFYLAWEEIFSQKYGHINKPPYDAVRIPLALANKTQFKNWLDSMEDQTIAAKIGNWIESHGKGIPTQFLVPLESIKSHGVPVELKQVLDRRKIVLTLTKSYRNVLESLGYFAKRDMMLCEQQVKVMENV